MLVLAKIQFSSRFRLGPAFVRLQPGKEETFFSGVTVTYLCFSPFFFHVQSSKRPLKTMLKGVGIGKGQGKGKGKPEGKGKGKGKGKGSSAGVGNTCADPGRPKIFQPRSVTHGQHCRVFPATGEDYPTAIRPLYPNARRARRPPAAGVAGRGRWMYTSSD